MGLNAIQIPAYECICDMCGYVWIVLASKPLPPRCARDACRSPLWNRPPRKAGRPRKLTPSNPPSPLDATDEAHPA